MNMQKNGKSDIKKQRLGIFSGTFDPIHSGHIHIAKEVINELNLNLLAIVPSFQVPHKGETITCSPKERLFMCQLACKGFDNIVISDFEIENAIKGYSIDTIDKLKETYMSDETFYIIGSDVYLSILNWKNLNQLIKKVTFCIVIRNLDDFDKVQRVKKELDKRGAKSYICKFKAIEVSSTNIKCRINDNESVEDLISKEAENLILAKKN